MTSDTQPAQNSRGGNDMDASQPLTEAQKSLLRGKLQNLKKTRYAIFCRKPVDAVALDIPTYPEIIKRPMDLSTMEAKLKDNQYHSIQDFVADFELIVSNACKVNGDSHPVTEMALNMKSYFDRAMETVPPTDKSQEKSTPPQQAASTPEVEKSPPQHFLEARNQKLEDPKYLLGALQQNFDVLQAELVKRRASEARLGRENCLLKAQLDKARAVLGGQGNEAGTS